MSKIKSLIQKLGIDETFTKSVPKPRKYNSVKKNMVAIEDCNFMGDLIEMPTTKTGYKYILSVVDLANDEFDIQPLKSKTPKEVKKAFELILSRPHLSRPYQIITDGGNEFKGDFDVYLKKLKIYHRTAMPYRHNQTANIEALNKQLVRLFNGYCNQKELETKKRYNEWTDIVDVVREELNKIRRKELPANDPPPLFNEEISKYNIGDSVFYKLMYPRDALGHKQSTSNFREGDVRWSKESRQIQNIFVMQDLPRYRYQLKGLPQVAFYEEELKLSNQKEDTYIIKKIIGKKVVKGETYYLVWWSPGLKKDATWEPEKNLIEDGVQGLLDLYNA
jgi:hypothetical protein